MSLADVHVIVAEDEALGDAAGNLGKNMGSGGTFYWFDNVHLFQQNPNFVGLFDIFFVFFHPR